MSSILDWWLVLFPEFRRYVLIVHSLLLVPVRMLLLLHYNYVRQKMSFVVPGITQTAWECAR